MTRPRRSLQACSDRPRALVRPQRRLLGFGPETHFVADGRTLTTSPVRGMNTADRAHRLSRAENAVECARGDLDEADCAAMSVERFSPETRVDIVRNVDAHLSTCVARLDAAAAELKAAKASASRPVGDLVTPPLVSLPQPRAWPNACWPATVSNSCGRCRRAASTSHYNALAAAGEWLW